jgi:uncharacterized spore protein YtfJ
MQAEAQGPSRLADELLQRIGQTVGQRAQASAVFGEPVQRGTVTVIPVARARFGFGGGGGAGDGHGAEGSGGGGGGGASVAPIGFIVLRDGGGAEFKRTSTLTGLAALVVAGSIAVLALGRLVN